MKRVLVATDFSTRSHLAVRRAGLIARQAGAEIVLLHVADEDRPERLVELERREARKILDEQVAAIPELRDVTCRALVAVGSAHESIAQTAKDLSADLIVMGSHRKQLLRYAFIGTTVERVIRLNRLPVLVVNTEATHPYAHVLAAVDLSDASKHALQSAQALGLLNASKVTVMHAFTAVARNKMVIAEVPEDKIAAYVEEEREVALGELTTFVAGLPFGSGSWMPLAVEGEPGPAILRAAARIQPDLIVVGTHGRSGVAKIFLGSVTEEVLRGSEIDILTINIGAARV